MFWTWNSDHALGYCLALYNSATWELTWHLTFEDLITSPKQVLICTDGFVRFVASDGSVWECSKDTGRTRIFPGKIHKVAQASDTLLGIRADTGAVIRLRDSKILGESAMESPFLEPVSDTDDDLYFVRNDNVVARLKVL